MTSQMLQLFLCSYRVVNIVNKSLFSMKRTSVSWEITCKWQSHCFLSNKFGRQALHQTEVQTKKLNLEKRLGYHFFQILNCNSLHSRPSRLSLQSVPPLLFAVFIVPSLMFWAAIFMLYSIKWSVVPTVLKWFWWVIRLLIK